MRDLRTRLTLLLCLGITVVVCIAPEKSPAAPKKKTAAGTPMIVVGGAAWCGYCKQLKERLASDPTVVPFASRFRISHVDLEDKKQAADFAKQFRLQKISLPTMVLAAPDGTPVDVAFGSPQGKDLPEMLQQALAKMGMDARAPADKGAKLKEPRDQKTAAKDKDPEVEARLAALREARKLLREKKTAEAVAAVAPYADKPRPPQALGSVIESLQKEGHDLVASAREQLEKQDRLVVGAVALVKTQRLYGKLPAVEKEIQAAFDLLAKSPQGKQIRKQAEALDKARALDESGDTAAAIESYQDVAAKFANTQVATMATKRINILKPGKLSE